MSDEERPVPYGVTPGDVAIAKAKEDAASGLTKKLNELGQAIDDVTQCTFGRACSSDDQEQESKPNVAGNMTDEEKAEYGGAGSGTGTPPPENDPKNQNEDKPANIKMADDKYLKRNGIDAHKLKEEFLGDGKNSNYDIYINKDSGELWIFRKGGKGDGIATGEFIK
ncbi:polymorphic toxin type 33 domain-containing protein [Kosakonia radicincitans]